MSILKFDAVELGYGRHAILEDINLQVEAGEFFGLVGPNGSGKTTLLKSMLGLLNPRQGEISWQVENVRRGYVPQRDQVDPIWPIRVRDLLKMTLRTVHSPWMFRKTEPARVEEVMQLTELQGYAERTLDTLSGGELQRVLLARALVIDPEILLLDEPTAAMDIVAAGHFLDLILRLHEAHDITVILVSHDLAAMADRAERLGILQRGTLYSGPAAEMLTSENLSSIYRCPIKVQKHENHTDIFPDDKCDWESVGENL